MDQRVMKREMFCHGKVKWIAEVIHLRLPVSSVQIHCVFCLIVQNVAKRHE